MKLSFRLDPYIMTRIIRQIERYGLSFKPEVCFSIQRDVSVETWDEFNNWLSDQSIEYFCHSPFHDDFRRYYGVERNDAMLVKLTFFNSTVE